jgi:hypothetical protein
VPKPKIEKDWYKSSYSMNEPSCVEIRLPGDGTVDVRNSNDPTGPVLHFTEEEWEAFQAGAADGEFRIA